VPEHTAATKADIYKVEEQIEKVEVQIDKVLAALHEHKVDDGKQHEELAAKNGEINSTLVNVLGQLTILNKVVLTGNGTPALTQLVAELRAEKRSVYNMATLLASIIAAVCVIAALVWR